MVDLDDNLLELDQLPSDDEQWRDAAPWIEKLVSAADLVTVSTVPLREVVERWSSRVVVVPNHLDRRLWIEPLDDPVVRSGPVRVLYMGTRTHERDLALLRSAVTRLDVELDVPVEVEVIGGEQEGYAQDWYRRFQVPSGTSHYPRFVRWIRSQANRWDLAVAPLADDEFNRYKSDLKFLEYSALGLPGVYSDVPAYRRTVRHGTTGLLARNTTDSWFEQLRRLVVDPELRRRIRTAAWDHVAQERTLDANVDELRQVLAALVAREDPRHAAA